VSVSALGRGAACLSADEVLWEQGE